MPTFTVVSRAPDPKPLDRTDTVVAADAAAAQAQITAKYQPPAVVISSTVQHVGVPYS